MIRNAENAACEIEPSFPPGNPDRRSVHEAQPHRHGGGLNPVADAELAEDV